MQRALVMVALVLCSCSKGSNNKSSGSDVDIDADTDSDTDVDTGADSDTDSDTDTDTDSDTDTDTDTDTDADTESGTEADTDTTTSTDDDTDTSTGTDSGTGTDTTIDTDTFEVTDGLVLYFYEKMYNAFFYDSHRVVVGPGDSVDPEDGDWVEVADAVSMGEDAEEKEDLWVLGVVCDLTGFEGTSVRVAFHYDGYNADWWWLDNICIATMGGPIYPDECDVFYEDFDGASLPELSDGWLDIGYTVNGIWRSSGGGMSDPYSAELYFADPWGDVDRYLVSPPIDLPIVEEVDTDTSTETDI